MRKLLTVIVFGAATLSPAMSHALCVKETDGARCVAAVPAAFGKTGIAVGDQVPDGSNMLLNPEYYGLPPVTGYWRYYLIDGQVYEVHPETMKVLAVVTGGNAVLH